MYLFGKDNCMSEELLINVTPQETRIAFVENGVLQEVHIERARKRGLVGNVYLGLRVLFRVDGHGSIDVQENSVLLNDRLDGQACFHVVGQEG